MGTDALIKFQLKNANFMQFNIVKWNGIATIK